MAEFKQLPVRVDLNDYNTASDINALYGNTEYVKDEHEAHAGADDLHVTQADKDLWNAHEADGVRHVTQGDKDSWNTHKNDGDIHVVKTEKDSWNAHENDGGIHVTQADKDRWDAKTKVHFAADIAGRDALSPNTGDMCVVVDDGDGKKASYLWTGTEWHKESDPDWENIHLDWASLENIPDSPEFNGLTLAARIINPPVPDPGKYKLYFKTDGKLYKLMPDGSEVQIGGDGGGGDTTIVSAMTTPLDMLPVLLERTDRTIPTPYAWRILPKSDGDAVFAGFYGTNAVFVVRSTGTTYTKANLISSTDIIKDICILNDVIHVCTEDLKWKSSSDNGNTWSATVTATGPTQILQLKVLNGRIYAQTYAGVFWSEAAAPSTFSAGTAGTIYPMAYDIGKYWAKGGSGEVYVSSNGSDFTQLTLDGTPTGYVHDMTVLGSQVYLATGDGLYRIDTTNGNKVSRIYDGGVVHCKRLGNYALFNPVSTGAGLWLTYNDGLPMPYETFGGNATGYVANDRYYMTNTASPTVLVEYRLGTLREYLGHRPVTASAVANAIVCRDSNGTIAGSVATVADKGAIADAARDFEIAKYLRWKNYGNGHSIIDASAGTSPTGSAINSAIPAVPWQASYPTLMGWNGANTYGLCVDLANQIRQGAPASPRNGDIWIE